MKDPKVKSINALARGLEVLQLLQTSGALTLHDLHRISHIPKASLLRILKTLHQSGAVWQRMADAAYVPSYSLSERAARLSRESKLVEVASPILQDLTARLKWPSVLAVPRLTHMEVIETNAAHAYFDRIALGPLGFQVNMLRSATGRAYLAFCEDGVREAILETLRRSDREGDRLAQARATVERILAETRAQGYGLRDPDFGGDFDRSRSLADDGRDSLAVAIRVGQHVPGTINLTWSKRALNREKATAAFANPLAAAAAEIAARFSGTV
jgi:IclR family transcriptional regulator, mhp operon transcriptional activator